MSNNSLVFNGLDITTISDEDLYSQLQSFGIPVGPIVGKSFNGAFEITRTINSFFTLLSDTTRSVYQRKLATLLQNGSPPVTEETEHTNGNGDTNEEKFSDSEEEEQVEEKEEDSSQPEVEEELFIQPSTSQIADPVVISTPEPLTAIRKRMTMTDRPSSSFSALPLVDRQVSITRIKKRQQLQYVKKTKCISIISRVRQHRARVFIHSPAHRHRPSTLSNLGAY